MDNHYHLLIQTIDPTLSKGMKHLNGSYTQWHHAEHDSVGHIFQGRFKAFLVEEYDYMLSVARYVVLNPVRARMVADPAEYPWSSYRAFVGMEPPPACLHTNKILGQFSNKLAAARRDYRAYVLEGIGLPSPFEDAYRGVILGTQQFIDELQEQFEPKEMIKEIPIAQRMEGRPSLADVFSGLKNKKERNAAIVLALCHLQYSGAEVGRFLDLDTSMICKIAKRGNATFQT